MSNKWTKEKINIKEEDKLDIEQIDDIAQEIKERLCPYEWNDGNKRENFEITTINIIVEHLRPYIKGNY